MSRLGKALVLGALFLSSITYTVISVVDYVQTVDSMSRPVEKPFDYKQSKELFSFEMHDNASLPKAYIDAPLKDDDPVFIEPEEIESIDCQSILRSPKTVSTDQINTCLAK